MSPPTLELNERQRAYLLAIFETAQELENEMRQIPYRPFQERPKASEWRWLEYAEPVPILGFDGSPLWKRIKQLGMVDQGTGSTFSALADRGLVTVQWQRINVHGQGVPHLRMTIARLSASEPTMRSSSMGPKTRPSEECVRLSPITKT